MDWKTFILIILALIIFTFCFVCYVGIKYDVANTKEENKKLKNDLNKIRKGVK